MKRIINKWKQLPDSFKSSFAFVLSSFILRGIAFITTPIFTRIMDMDEYGMVATYNSWISILEIFALLGLTSAGVFNVGLSDNKDKRDEYISSCIGLCNIATIITFAIITILKIIFGNELILPNELLVVMLIHFIFNPAQIFWIIRQRYEYKYKAATIVTILSTIISQVLSVIFIVTIDKHQAFNKIVFTEVGSLLFSIPIYIMLLKRSGKFFNFKQWKNILILSIPLIPHYLAQHVMSSSDRIMITELVSKSAAAVYNVVANIGMIATIFWSAVNASLVPYTFENIRNKDNNIGKVVNSLIFFYFAACIFVIIIAPEIVKILAPAKYYNGIYAVPPLTVVVFTQALYNIYANIEFYYKKTKNIAVATVIAAIINLGLNYTLIPKYSFIGASYATLVSYSILILLHYIGYKKCEINNIYDDKIFLILYILLLIFSILCNFIYKFIMIRYSLIIVLLLIFVFNYKKIILIIKQIKKK